MVRDCHSSGLFQRNVLSRLNSPFSVVSSRSVMFQAGYVAFCQVFHLPAIEARLEFPNPGTFIK